MHFYKEKQKAKMTLKAYLNACQETQSQPKFGQLKILMAQKYPFGERFLRNLLAEFGLKEEENLIIKAKNDS